jgi:UDP-glucose:(heptosyl)LPS alpha-1,3-glucosyltransferase
LRYKLAFVIERYFEFGGLQRDMRRFALACADAGHAVTVFTGRWDGPDEPMLTIQLIDIMAASNHAAMKKLDIFVRDVKKRNEFDCIIGFNRVSGLDIYYGGDICLKNKLNSSHRSWLRFLPRYRTYLQLERGVFGPASDAELMMISPVEAEAVRRIYNTPPKRIHLLPPGIDRQRLTSGPLTSEQKRQFRKDLGVQDDELMILTVGSSFHTKGVDRVIYAIASLPETVKKRCRYIVVGLGKEKQFKAIAQKAGLGERAHFMGGRKDVPDFYHAADLLVHPARTENTGTTLLEAMVTGVPVIATGNCGYAHYIQQANAGIVCPEPFDQKNLTEAFSTVLENKELRGEFAQNGRTFCQTADISSMVERGTEIILNRAQQNRGKKRTTCRDRRCTAGE